MCTHVILHHRARAIGLKCVIVPPEAVPALLLKISNLRPGSHVVMRVRQRTGRGPTRTRSSTWPKTHKLLHGKREAEAICALLTRPATPTRGGTRCHGRTVRTKRSSTRSPSRERRAGRPDPRSAHPAGDRPKKPEASRTLHPGGVGADDLPSEPTPGREAGPRAAQYVAVRLASENGRVRDQSRGSHLTPRGCG